MEWGDIIGVVNVIATIALSFFGYYLNKKINTVNINAVFYNEIFNEILLKKLPKAVNEALNNNFSNFQNLDDILVELDKNILYLKYKNKNFYKKINDKITQVDDFLSHVYKVQIKSGTKNKFEKLIEELYEIIYTNYNN